MRAAIVLLLPLALLAGCVGSLDRPTLRAAAVTLQTEPSEGYPGLVVTGHISGVEEGLRVQAVARNGGNRTYQVETGCSSPWSQQLFFGDDPVELREPGVRCDSFKLRPFAPGDESAYDVRWDGRVWDPDAQRMTKALPGEHTWSIRFVAYPPEALAAKRFDLDFEVTVLPD